MMTDYKHQNAFNKALLLLDKDRIEEARATLDGLLESATREADVLYVVRTRVVLGDLAYQLNETDSAREHMQAALACEVDEDFADVVAFEIDRAKEVLRSVADAERTSG